ncbi:hypothetical protein TNCV_414901 [Trichonephila clavipes]|nr:hypothetical protein TNCV_414901 [Trichonephila clavipes]
MWDALGRQVAGRNNPPTNKNTIIRALTEEWDKLPQQLLNNVVQTSDKANICLNINNFIKQGIGHGYPANFLYYYISNSS